MTSKKFPLCEKYGLSTLADLEASKVEQALSKAEGERQMNCEACQHDMFRLGEKAGREQGKLDLLNRMYENGYISESTRDFYIEQENLKSIEQKRLKSQIKEGEKDE